MTVKTQPSGQTCTVSNGSGTIRGANVTNVTVNCVSSGGGGGGTPPSVPQYFKASNTGAGDGFGVSVALSADGNTLAVGAYKESSNATGINGNQADNLASGAGAVYLY